MSHYMLEGTRTAHTRACTEAATKVAFRNVLAWYLDDEVHEPVFGHGSDNPYNYTVGRLVNIGVNAYVNEGIEPCTCKAVSQ